MTSIDIYPDFKGNYQVGKYYCKRCNRLMYLCLKNTTSPDDHLHLFENNISLGDCPINHET